MKKSKSITRAENKKHQQYITNMKLGGNPNKYGKSNTYKKPNIELSPSIPAWATTLSEYKSIETNKPINNAIPVRYEDEFAIREEIALKEKERKKQFVAVAYNKGGYVYLGENPPDEIVKSIGKK